MPELVVMLKNREIARVPVVKRTVAIGRDPDGDVVIDNVGVSRLHATIRFLQDRALLVDNGSSNGTFVNGERVATHVLADRDRIELGKFTVTYLALSGPPLPDKVFGAPDERTRRPHEGPKAGSHVPGTMRMSPDQVKRAIASGKVLLPGGGSGPDTASRAWLVFALLLVAIVVAGAAALLLLLRPWAA